MPVRALRTYVGAVAVVTGAASGIGRALAEELARRGGDVVLADLQDELAAEVAAGIRATGGQARACRLDVTDAAAVDALLRATAEGAGRLDYVFNNAGIGIGGAIERHTLEDWERIIGVNLRGVVHGVHSALPIMRRQGFGHIVNTSSAAGLVPGPGTVAYSATKHAVVGLSTSLRAELAATGIRVSVICPGVVRTPILGGGKYGKLYTDLSAEQQRQAIEQTRPMAPDRFARQALHAVARNSAIIVIPAWWNLFWWLNRLSPDLMLWLMQKALSKAFGDQATKS